LRIRALARRRPTARGRTLRAAGVELDPLTGTVTRDGRAIQISAKERAVLEALLKASPGALSAERLLEQAWDENVDPFTNTVKVTIARLRRKLGCQQPVYRVGEQAQLIMRTRHREALVQVRIRDPLGGCGDRPQRRQHAPGHYPAEHA
jgi:DNA-binding response OmpR family regulator